MTAVSARPKRKRRVASDEAHAWARNLTLHNPFAKSVLRAIALYTNDEGSCIAGLSTLAEDCDLSEDTVRKRLKFLEDIGAIVRLPNWLDDSGRRNSEGRGKRTTDDIRLLLEADSDEIEARARGEIPAEGGADGDEISPRPQQGLNSEAETVSPLPVPPLAVGQPSDSGKGLTSEPEPEPEASPQPPSGGEGGLPSADQGKQEPEHFAEFWAGYPGHRVMDRYRALQVFFALNDTERALARAAAPLLAEDLVKLKRKPKDAYKWLRDRGFEQYPDAKLPEKVQELPPKVFYPEGSPEFCAVKAAFVIGRMIEFRSDWDGPRRGIWRRGAVGLDLLKLAPFVDADVEALPEIVIEHSQEFAAWRDRLKRWTGYLPEARKIWTEPRDPAVHDLPFTHPQHRWRKHVLGLRVPWPFPPSATGKIYSAGTRLMSDQDLQDFK